MWQPLKLDYTAAARSDFERMGEPAREYGVPPGVSRFLLDANLSPQTARFLRETLGLDSVHLHDVTHGSPTDEEVAELAQREQRVIVTYPPEPQHTPTTKVISEG